MTKRKPAKRRLPTSGSNPNESLTEDATNPDLFEAEAALPGDRSNHVEAQVAQGVEYELPSDFEDEEISEDEAFDEEDEKTFGAYFTKKTRKAAAVGTHFNERKAAPKGEVFLSDLIHSDSDNEDAERIVGRSTNDIAESEEDGENDDENDDEDVEDEDDDNGEGGSDAVLAVVKRLGKMSDAAGKASLQKVQSEAVPEGEYNTPHGQSGKLTLASVLKTLDPTSTKHGDLKKKLSKLSRAEKVSGGTAGVVESRAERKVGYAEAKKEVSKWKTIVQENRQATSLSFPLNAPKHVKSTTLGLTAGFSAKTDLEKEIEEALEKSGMVGDKQVEEAENEDLAEITEDPEEIRRRRGELSKLRALMFYDEQKHKRQKKIKSKMYRKLKKRREARQQEKAELQLRESDPAAAKQLDEQAALQRAEERMTLKHKNTSKFIRGLLKNGGTHRQRTRDAIIEQLEQEEKLRKRIGTLQDDNSDESSGAESDEDAMEKAKRLHDEIVDDGNKPAETKGLFALKFMQNGLEKKRKLAEERAKRLIDAAASGLASGDEEEEDKGAEKVVSGRRKFERKGKRSKQSGEGPEKFPGKLDVKAVAQSSGFVKAAAMAPTVPEESEVENKPAENNPWLSVAKTKKRKVAAAPSKVVVDVSHAASAKPSTSTSKKGSKSGASKEQAELLRRAFVTAGVAEEEFEEDKRKELEEVNGKRKPEVTDLPGWGSWTGEGISSKKKKAKTIDQSKRKPQKRDKKPHVIVSKKRNKKAKKYFLDKVPYPFTSREQYERSLKNPIGNDWNTVETFRKNVKPEVLTKAGTIIPPVQKTERYEVPYHKRDVEAA